MKMNPIPHIVMKWILSLISILFISTLSLQGQNSIPADENPYNRYYMYVLSAEGDTIPLVQLHDVHIFGRMKFKNEKHRQEYAKLVSDVRKVYPYARLISQSIIETYEFMETLPDEKAKQKHLEQVQKFMMDEYKPQLKKMSRSQGKILIKLIDRECNTPSYNIVKALVGSFKAGVYNIFAGMFGNSLKTEYDPYGKDRDIESIVIQIQEGSLDYYYGINYHSYSVNARR